MGRHGNARACEASTSRRLRIFIQWTAADERWQRRATVDMTVVQLQFADSGLLAKRVAQHLHKTAPRRPSAILLTWPKAIQRFRPF